MEDLAVQSGCPAGVPPTVPAPSGTWKLLKTGRLARVFACAPPISEKYVFCRERTRPACPFDRRCRSFAQNKIVAALYIAVGFSQRSAAVNRQLKQTAMRFPGSTIGTSKPNRNPRSDLDCVSLAFRSRFACKWNAELTISKRVIGIFRLRFACLQNSPFSEDLNRRDAEDKRVQEPGKQIPDAGVFRIKGKSLTVMFLPASLRVSASRR